MRRFGRRRRGLNPMQERVAYAETQRQHEAVDAKEVLRVVVAVVEEIAADLEAAQTTEENPQP